MVIDRHMISKDKLTQVSLKTTIREVMDLFNEKDYLSLPVVEGDRLEGVIYKSKIYGELVNSKLDIDQYLDQTVESLYEGNLIHVQAKDLLEHASTLLVGAKQSFLPVYLGEKFVGIITHTAIFEAYSKLLGVGRGTRISVRTTNTSGRVALLTKEVASIGGNVITLVIDDIDIASLNLSRIIIRVDSCDVDKLVENIIKKGFKVERID